MAWFIGRSVVVIALAFILGLVVGWLWWRRRKVHFGESQAIAKISAKQQTRVDDLTAQLARKVAELGDLDQEIARLHATAPAAAVATVTAVPVTEVYDAQASASASDDATPAVDVSDAETQAAVTSDLVDITDAGTVDVSSGSATWSTAAVPVSSGHGSSTERATTTTGSPAPAESSAPAQAPALVEEAPATAGLVTTPSEPSTETLATLATPFEEIRTEGDQVPAIPEQGGAPEAHRLIDLDSVDAVATADAEAAAATSDAVTTEDATATSDATDATDASDAVDQPAETVAAETVVEEDLERIEGVGPRIGAALRGAGIHSFRQLADAETATLQGALEQAGLRFAPSLPTWGRQARLLADGDEAGFVALTQQLVGGRDVSGTK